MREWFTHACNRNWLIILASKEGNLPGHVVAGGEVEGDGQMTLETGGWAKPLDFPFVLVCFSFLLGPFFSLFFPVFSASGLFLSGSSLSPRPLSLHWLRIAGAEEEATLNCGWLVKTATEERVAAPAVACSRCSAEKVARWR